jgi:transposase InsO family protein
VPAVPTAPLPALAPEAAHWQRLDTFAHLADGDAAAEHRRGSAWQWPHRQLEQQVRQEVVAFRQWLAEQGWTRLDVAQRLDIKPRTLRDWEQQWAQDGLALHRRGRPVQRSQRDQRQQVLALLGTVGPGVGLPVLQGYFHGMPRAELRDLLWRYRRVWVERHHQTLHVLHWHQPGRVWAIDYALAPVPLAEGDSAVVAVRDLASGQQLAWLPVAAATAEETVLVLTMLFTMYGAPLVLKMDNGSPFTAAATQALLARWQVQPLYSPPGCPAYNGAIEAGIGSMKTRTLWAAAHQGHPEVWLEADLELARWQANLLSRPRGPQGTTPEEAWAQRPPLSSAERERFRDTVARLTNDDRPPEDCPPQTPEVSTADAATASPPRSTPAVQPGAGPDDGASASPQATEPISPHVTDSARTLVPAPDAATLQRQAISRALVAHGYLTFTRRRIPLPIKRPKVTKFT